MTVTPDATSQKIISEELAVITSAIPVIHDIGSWSVKVIYQAHALLIEEFQADLDKITSYLYSTPLGAGAAISVDVDTARITFGFKFPTEQWEEALKLAKAVAKESLNASSHRRAYDFHDCLVGPATEV